MSNLHWCFVQRRRRRQRPVKQLLFSANFGNARSSTTKPFDIQIHSWWSFEDRSRYDDSFSGWLFGVFGDLGPTYSGSSVMPIRCGESLKGLSKKHRMTVKSGSFVFYFIFRPKNCCRLVRTREWWVRESCHFGSVCLGGYCVCVWDVIDAMRY